MSDALSLDPKTSALLVMDFQAGVLQGNVPDAESLLGRTAGLIAAARKAGVPVVYVVVGFRPGYPEVSPRNKAFGTVKENGRFLPGAPGTEIHPAVAPAPSEVVVTKHRFGAFSNTELELILRARGVDTLLLAGVSTSGVVLSTLRHAADFDYRIVVVEDCCADRDPEVHRVLTEKVFPRQATLAKAEAVAKALG
jgi:nicotinamidase-related amidase